MCVQVCKNSFFLTTYVIFHAKYNAYAYVSVGVEYLNSRISF